MHDQYKLVRELALANTLKLFEYWGLDYRKINDIEVDFINPTRKDSSHGACRFNLQKGLGADFAGTSFTGMDFSKVGFGFTKDDFAHSAPESNFGFDIIGLCQRLHNCHSYREASQLIMKHLEDINNNVGIEKINREAIEAREHKNQLEALKRLRTAEKTWNRCKNYVGTLGEKYLHNRMIFLDEVEPNIRFHSMIKNNELNAYLPTLLFKVSKLPESPLEAIHRIYLSNEASKANVADPKKALGSIKGCAIWFGNPSDELCIVEGPENALSIRSIGYRFVCSTINSSNFGNLVLPDTIKKVILFPDSDEAGIKSAKRAAKNYSEQKKSIKIVFPPKHENKKKWDWNDELMLRGTNVR